MYIAHCCTLPTFTLEFRPGPWLGRAASPGSQRTEMQTRVTCRAAPCPMTDCYSMYWYRVALPALLLLLRDPKPCTMHQTVSTAASTSSQPTRRGIRNCAASQYSEHADDKHRHTTASSLPHDLAAVTPCCSERCSWRNGSAAGPHD